MGQTPKLLPYYISSYNYYIDTYICKIWTGFELDLSELVGSMLTTTTPSLLHQPGRLSYVSCFPSKISMKGHTRLPESWTQDLLSLLNCSISWPLYTYINKALSHLTNITQSKSLFQGRVFTDCWNAISSRTGRARIKVLRFLRTWIGDILISTCFALLL